MHYCENMMMMNIDVRSSGMAAVAAAAVAAVSLVEATMVAFLFPWGLQLVPDLSGC